MSGHEEPTSEAGGVPPAAAPHRVRLPVNIHHWDTMAMLHWPVAPSDIVPLLPEGVRVLTFDGTAWVSATPFFIRVRPPAVPAVPPGWAFPETNLRTYVTGPDGREGLWFLRMEVAALWFVAVLRSLGLPYFHQRMSVDAVDGRIHYESSPRQPGGDGGHNIVVRPGQALEPKAGGPWDRFVTARWGAYHRRGPVLFNTPVEHPPWPLHSCAVEVCEVDALFRDAGLPAPHEPPVAHFSPGVRVKVGWPYPSSRSPR